MFIVFLNFILLKIAKEGICKALAYADDTTLLFSLRPSNIQADFEKALTQAEKVVDIFKSFGLLVNASKTNLVIFRTPQRSISLEPAFFCGNLCQLSQTTKCLGLTLHETVRWQAHLSAVAPKCYAISASLRRLRELGVPKEGLLMVYRTLFLPVLTYAISIWGGGYDNISRRAQILQNDALRAIYARRRRDSVQDIYFAENLLLLHRLYKIRVAVLAYKISKQLVPPEISFPLTAVVTRSTRRATTFEIPFVSKEISKHALAQRLPSIWGSIPREIRSLTSVKIFVREIKKYDQL